MPGSPAVPLRVAYLVYRGNPHCGGQGVYTRYLARELAALGHEVEIFSGPPYPELDDPASVGVPAGTSGSGGVKLTRVPSLDLYRPDNPFRVPWPWEFKSRIDVQEFAIMCGAGFPEPYTFSLRVRRMLRHRRHQFDLLHDNQCLGTGLVKMIGDGWPVLTTLHHPITIDRDLDLAHESRWWRRLAMRRWYGFLGMQTKVARRIPRHVTVSESSKRDIAAQMDIPLERLHVVPVGVDPATFRPVAGVARVRGRIMTTASADVPMKGLAPLLEALAKLRTERDDAHLVVIGKMKGKSPIPALIDHLGLEGSVTFVSGVTTERIVELYAEAEVAAVPSLYEGFSLPAIEAMACGVPVVATTGGALPEVVGRDGDTGLLVPPADPSELAAGLRRVLDDPELRARVGGRGRARVLERFTWRITAARTVEQYRALLDEHRAAQPCGGASRRAVPGIPAPSDGAIWC